MQDPLYSYTLPFPPSVNHYWRSFRGRTVLTKAGLGFRRSVLATVGPVPRQIVGDVRCRVLLSPPDKRRRDVDNSIKAILDALTKSGVWRDDCQVCELTVKRGGVTPGGSCLVEIWEI